MKQRKLIGRTSQKLTIELDRSDVRRYAAALASSNPIHFEVAAARKAGFPDLVAPATMVATLGGQEELLALLDVHPKNILHSEQTVDLRRPLFAGETVKVQSVISDVHERPIGSATTGFVTIEDQGADAKGRQLFYARRVLAIRGGFPRR